VGKAPVLLFLVVAVAAASPAQAGLVTGNTIKFTGTAGSAIGGMRGGAFSIDGPGSFDFLSFCIERNENIAFDTTYYVKLDTAARGGGAGGATGSPSSDPLDSRTAYLYSRFLDGALGSGVGGAMTQDDIDGLQYAIWRIEQEFGTLTASATYGGVLGAYASKKARADYYFNLADANANGSLYGVQVMQVWASYNSATGAFSGARQDQIVRVTVPDGGATAMLLGTALLGLAGLRRRLAK
jgi:hypothetical protein